MSLLDMAESLLGDFFTDLPPDFDIGLPSDIFAGQPIIGETGMAGDDGLP